MFDNIIAFSLKNKLFIAILTLALILWGSWSATRLPIDAVPDITNNQVQIITLCPTLAGQEVEQLVTYPIEQSIANLPDIEELRSISRFGLSVVTVVFEENVDIYFARQLINESLKEAEENIPEGVGRPELAPVSTGLGEVYQYILHPTPEAENKYSAMDLRTMQDWIVARQLYGTPGIAEVNSFGGELKQYEVSINPDRLLAMQVSITDIFEALEKNNENTGGAYIDKSPNAYFIRGVGLVNSLEDIRNIAVKSNENGIPILIKDVAEVGFGHAVRYGAMTYNGEKDAVGGIIMMLKGANSAEVVARIEEKIPTIQKSLPNDVILEPFLNRTDLVGRAMSTVEKNLIEGALIVIFVLVLFLGNLRAGLIVASAIPLSLLFALGLMHVFGVSANLMSLGAIDFGLIVDGAVIIVESVFHRIQTHKSKVHLTKKEMDETVFQSAKRMMNSAAFGQIIILIVYLPILTLIGIEGKMFGPMAKTVSFAILGAFILSLTYIPMMSSVFLSKKSVQKKNISERMMKMFQRMYAPLLNKALQFKKIIIAITIIVFAYSIYVFSKMGSEFIPTLNEGDFAFHCILPQGTSLSQSIETSMQASRLIKEFDEVKMVVGKTGAGEVPTDPMPPEATDIMIILKPQEEWNRNISYNDLADEIEEKLLTIPGVFFEKNQPIQMRFNELMTGIRQDVAIKIFGENLDTLLAYANKVAPLIKTVEGTTEPMVERVEGLPQIVVKYNRTQLANYHLNIEDVNHLISTAFAGGKAGVVFENERRFDLVVRLDSAHRKDIQDLSQLYLPTPEGIQIPLSQVATINYEEGPAQISREDGKRRIVVGFNVEDRDVSSVVKDIQTALNERIILPEGYYYSYGGTFENLEAASKRLMIAVPLALILIFMLLYFTFNSFKQALLIYTAIPMSAIGGVFALLLRDMPFSISAGIGFIALFGVAVLNGIVLIGTFNQLEKEGIADYIERIKQGTKMRLRPVLMTATVASLGFFPMAFSQGAGAEVQKPLATVVIGGLISATLLTLFVLPLLYSLFSGRRKKMIHAPTAIYLFIFSIILLFPQQGFSQNAEINKPKSLEEILEMALQNNANIKAAQLNIESAQFKKKSFIELPKTEVTFQYGQYNSIENDMSFSISQNIPFPTYFSAQSKLYKAEIQNSELELLQTKNELISQITSLYFSYQYLIEKKIALAQIDSAYSKFVQAADLRYQTGETNLLEKITAETKQAKLKITMQQNESEIIKNISLLKALLQETDELILEKMNFKVPSFLSETIDTSQLKNNPTLKLLSQKMIIQDEYVKLEKAATMPEISIGYFNQSITGFQLIDGEEIYFDRSKHFDGVSVGLAIPLTFFSNSAKIKSLELSSLSYQKEAESGAAILQSQLQVAIQNYQQHLSTYHYYITSALQNAEAILNTATVSFNSGEIGYIEYLNALETAGEIQLGYLESIQMLNQSSIQIQYLLYQ